MNKLSRILQPLCLAGVFAFGAMVPAQAQELKIGFLAPRTGIFTAIGTDMVNGFQMYLDEHNGMLGGVKAKFIVEDDQGKPDVDVTKAKKLILQDKVDMLVGALLASSAYALGPVSNEFKTLYIGSSATADDLAQRQVAKYPYVAFSTWVPSLPNHPLGQWACDQGYKKVVAVVADYAFGYEQMGGFQQTFEENGGKILKKLWPPIVTPDYTPYLAQISDCDGVCQGFAGSNPLRFMKQYAAAGLKYPVVTGETGGDDALLHSFGDEAIGMHSCCPYTSDLPTDANKRFISGMEKNFNVLPGFYAAGLYVNCQVVEAGLKNNGGKSDDKAKLMAALRAVSLTETPRGPIKFDHFGNVIGDFYVRRLEKANGKLVNKTVKTYHNVSQFWTYDEKKFLAQPVYSRDFPPIKS